jgi:hypothetical protein
LVLALGSPLICLLFVLPCSFLRHLVSPPIIATMGNEYSIKPLSAEEDVTAAVSAGRDAYSKRTNDETVMAYFGKKQQLRVRPPSAVDPCR